MTIHQLRTAALAALFMFSLVGTTALAPSGAASPAVPGQIGAVRLVDAVASQAGTTHVVTMGSKTIGRVRFAHATRFIAVTPGSIPVKIARGQRALAAAPIVVGPGCAVTVVAAEPQGPGNGTSLLAYPECEHTRVPALSASVRLLNLTGDVGAVELRLSGVTPTPVAAPFAAGERVVVTAGDATLSLRSPGGAGAVEISGSASLLAYHVYTAMLVGGGETPLSIRVVLDAVEPSMPPPSDQPINTGSSHDRAGRSRPRRSAARAPAQIVIPALGVDAAVIPIESTRAKDLVTLLPGDQVAWFTGTNRPGAPGVAVLAGHVSFHGPAVFAGLAQLQAGDRIMTTDVAGHVWSYEVRETVVVPKRSIPDDFYAASYLPTLVLVSCTGPVDRSTGLHRDNVLVIATALT